MADSIASSTTPARASSGPPATLAAMANLAHYHREHEKYYARAPLRDADAILRASQTLKALADRWSETRPAAGPAMPYAGCEDLNTTSAIETSGVLFMEGAGEPAELVRMKEDLRVRALASEQTGAWLEEAMTASWQAAGNLLQTAPLADLLGDRHRIIANNRLAAAMARITGALLRRAADLLDVMPMSTESVRADLAGPRSSPGYLYSAAMLLDRAADLAVTSTTLTRDSEPAWRAWQARVDAIRSEQTTDA